MSFRGLDADLCRLFAYFLPHKGKLALASVFLIGAASMSSLTATLLGKITDAGFYEGAEWVIYGAPLALTGVTLGFAFCTVMSTYLMAKVSQAVLVTLRTSMFERILLWPESEYQRNTSGRISSKFVNEATLALSGAAQSFIILVRDSVQVVALLAILFWHDWQLTLVTFVIAPGLAYTLKAISTRVRRIVKENQETLGSMISRVQESFDAQSVIKVNGTYAFEEKRFSVVNERIRRLSLKLIRMNSTSTPVTQVLTIVAVACVVGVALLEAQQGMLTFGEFLTFLSALLLLRDPIQHLAGLNGTFASISVAARSIFDTLDAKTETDEGTETLADVKGELRYEGVTLRYANAERDALRSIDLIIRPGEHVALVGPSGSGKTSLANLLPRFLEPTAGRILLDGVDIHDLTLENLRNQIAFVTQDVVLFDDTVRNNITYGLKDVTDEALNEAVDAAALREFVDSLPKGIDTPVGEGGGLLSGGQKQRLSIARAFLRNAPILIMDEATSALDSKTEKAVTDALARLQRNRTCITIAHRFASIQHADRVVVLVDGVIREEGTAEELLAQDGVFKRLSTLQTGASIAQ